MWGVIAHNSVQKRSIYINKSLSYSKLWCFTAAILFAILEFANQICVKLLQFISSVIPRNLKKRMSLSQTLY